jgi:Ser/Thr protein kinase RdoA (MazF antagonist)
MDVPTGFDHLTPDLVLDALASVGLHGDGRLMALSSYENRVYQIPLEEAIASGDVVVAKFYRPGRWSDTQISEEHSFSAELMAAEVPVIGPLELNGATLHHFNGFAFSVSPRRGGRPPELDSLEVLEWIGRFLARIHTVGAARPFSHRPALDLQTFGLDSRDWLLHHQIVPMDVQSAWAKVADAALKMIAKYQ